MKKILLPVLGAFALILGACANPGPDPVPPGTTYEVIFKNYDGSTLYTTEVEHGGNAVYEGETPTQPSDDARIKHDWTGWDKSLYEIKEDKTITATYSTSYLMRFYKTAISEDFDPEVDVAPTLEEEDLLYEGWMLESDTLGDIDEVIPKLEKLMLPVNDAYGYEWDSFAYLDEDNEVTTPTNSQTVERFGYQDFYSIYDDREVQLNDVVYVVSFFNADENNTLLYVDGLREGETHAAYAGETPPTLPDNVEENISYTFVGWYLEGDETETVIDLATYIIETDTNLVAKYETSKIGGETPVTYTVTFANWDETVLFVDTVEQGGTAAYEGETPTRPDDSEYTYTFSGWDRDLTNVQSSFTTTAQYTSTPIDTPVTGGPMVVYGPDYSVEDGLLLTLNTNQTDPNIASEYYARGITLEQGDTFKLFDSALNADIEIDDYRNDLSDTADSGSAFYTGDVTLEGNVITVQNAGEYQVYLKTYVENDWIELWIPAITSTPDPNPPVSTADYYILGEGSFNGTNDPWTVEGGIALEPNTNAASGVEYMSTGTTLEEGDIWKIYDATNKTYIAMNEIDKSTGCAFGPVKDMEQVSDADGNVNYQVNVTGAYDIYYTIYDDSTSTPDGMWHRLYVGAVTTYVPPVGEAENYVVGSGSFVSEEWSVAGGVALSEISDIPDGKQHHASVTFEAGDQFKICSADGSNWYDNNVWENGEGSAFASGAMEISDGGNILVNEAGTYDIYFKIYNSGYVSTWIA